MRLYLTYQSSEEGIRMIKLFKYLYHNQKQYQDNVEEMSWTKNELADLKLVIFPAARTITGYENIRSVLKQIFPSLMDLTPTKRVPVGISRTGHNRGRGSLW
jgi:hypothetical protein